MICKPDRSTALLSAAGFVLLAWVSPASALDQAKLLRPIDHPLTFVFIPKVIHPWYDAVKAGANYAADEEKKLGITVNVQWDEPPQADVSDQNKRIESDIGKHPDGLAVSCLDPSTNNELLSEGVKAGVNIYTFDTFCSDDYNFVGHKQDFEDGVALADFLAKQIGDKGKVGILAGSLTATNHVARVKGFKAEIAKHPGVSIVFEQPDNDNLDSAVNLTENALQAHPDLAGIFGANASAPIGAARAVVNAGLKGKVKVVGMDDLPEMLQFIKDGVAQGTMAQRQWEIGYWVVKYLVAKNQNHTVPKVHETGSQIITADKLAE